MYNYVTDTYLLIQIKFIKIIQELRGKCNSCGEDLAYLCFGEEEISKPHLYLLN